MYRTTDWCCFGFLACYTLFWSLFWNHIFFMLNNNDMKTEWRFINNNKTKKNRCCCIDISKGENARDGKTHTHKNTQIRLQVDWLVEIIFDESVCICECVCVCVHVHHALTWTRCIPVSHPVFPVCMNLNHDLAVTDHKWIKELINNTKKKNKKLVENGKGCT